MTELKTTGTSVKAISLLFMSGLILALSTTMSKLSRSAGIEPIPFLTWSMLLAGIFLLMSLIIKGRALRFTRQTIEYFLVAGLLTSAGANLIFFYAVHHLGISFISLMLSLPPILTYAGALMLRMEGFSFCRTTAVLLAMAGTILLVSQSWQRTQHSATWEAIALLGPVLLAAGNLYRSLRWPAGESAQSLAPGMLLGSTFLLTLFAIISGKQLQLPTHNSTAALLILCQAGLFSAQFVLMFQLQKTGGPIIISLMGGVSALFSVPIAIGLLSENIPNHFLISTLLILTGIVLLVASPASSQAKKIDDCP